MTDLLMALLLASIGVELFATPQPQLSRRTPFWYSALAQEGVLFMALSARRQLAGERDGTCMDKMTSAHERPWTGSDKDRHGSNHQPRSPCRGQNKAERCGVVWLSQEHMMDPALPSVAHASHAGR